MARRAALSGGIGLDGIEVRACESLAAALCERMPVRQRRSVQLLM
jgi:hypothetical protein